MAAAAKDAAVACLFKGAHDAPAGLFGHFTPSDTHTHTVMLSGEEGCSLHLDAETLGEMYGIHPRAIDLMGATGISMKAGSTTHEAPVAITFSTTDTEGNFVPIQTLSRSTFSSTSGSMGDHQMCHYIAMPEKVGYINGETKIQFHPDQCVSPHGTNLAARKLRWDDSTPMQGDYAQVASTGGMMHAVPLEQPAQCKISHLLSQNRAEIATIAPGSKIVKTSTGAEFAMLPDASLKSVQQNMSESFKTHSALNGGITVTARSLDPTRPLIDAVTTCTFTVMKDPETVAARVAAGMSGETSGSMHQVETITHGYLPHLLGETTGSAAGATAAPLGLSELTTELAALVGDEKP